MMDPTLSRSQKQQQMIVLQRTYGEELLTLVRYVPVYDERSGRVVSFDSYTRSRAQEYDVAPGSPLAVDPVGASMRIYFDPSVENIVFLTGVGMTPGQREAALKQYQAEQRERDRRVEQLSQELERSWQQIQKQGSQAADEAKRQAEEISRLAKERIGEDYDQIRREAEDVFLDLKQGTDEQLQEIQDQMDDVMEDLDEELEDLNDELENLQKSLQNLFP